MHELSRQAFHAPLQFAPAQFDILERGLERMRGMLHQFAADIFPSEAPLEAAAMHELLAFTRAASAIHLADTPDSAGVVTTHWPAELMTGVIMFCAFRAGV